MTGFTSTAGSCRWVPIAILGATTGAIAIAPAVRAESALAERARQVLVRIDGQNPSSGTLVAREGRTYWVLAAGHAVATPDEYAIVAPDGRRYPLDYGTVRRLPGVDLALLAFQSDRDYATAALAAPDFANASGNSPEETLRERETYLLVAGWPAIAGSRLPGSQPVLSAGRAIPAEFAQALTREPEDFGYRLFYTNRTERGLSGGPVLDAAGRLVGIHGRSEGQELYDDRAGELVRVKLGFSAGIPVGAFLRAIDRAGVRLPLAVSGEPLRWSPAAARDRAASPEENRVAPWLQVGEPPWRGDAVAWTNWGNQLYRAGQFEAALAAFDRAIVLRGDFYPAWYQRANVLYALGDPMAALAAFDRAAALAPEFSWAWRDRGALLASLGQAEAALDSFDRALAAKPDDRALWYIRGNLLVRALGQPGDALDSYARAIALQGDFALAWLGRGRALLDLDKDELAVQALDRAIALEPDLAPAWILRGAARRSLGDIGRALADFDRGLALTPDDPRLWATVAVARADWGDRAGALAAIDRAIVLDPDSGELQQLREELRANLQPIAPGPGPTRLW